YTPYSHTAHPLSYRIPRPRLPTPFFSTHTPPPAIYPLSLHDALPIYLLPLRQPPRGPADGEQDREDVHREPHRLVNDPRVEVHIDRKSTRLNSSHGSISYAVFCLKKKKKTNKTESQYTDNTLMTQVSK